MTLVRSNRDWLGTYLPLVIITALAFSPMIVAAQNYRWTIKEDWGPDYQVFGIDCARGGPCYTAVTFRIFSASIVRKSTDFGLTWSDALVVDRTSELFPLSIISVHAVNDRSLFAAFNMGTIGVSDDAGSTWSFRRAHDTGWGLSMHMRDESRGIALFQINFAAKTYVVKTTTDAWESSRELVLPDSIPFMDTLRALSDQSVYPTSVAMLGDSTFISVIRSSPTTTAAKTTDGGKSWSFRQFGPDEIQSVLFSDSLIGWAYGGAYRRFYGDTLPAVHRTTDGGESWELTLSGSEVGDLNFRGTDVVAAAFEKHVYSSSDGGVSWRRDSAHIRGAVNLHVALPDSGDALIATTAGALLRSDGIPTAIPGSVEGEVPLRIWIDGEGQSLLIEHKASARSVGVEVFDVKGSLVGAMPEQRRSAGRTAFDVRHLEVSPGRYFAVVKIDGLQAGVAAIHVD